MVRATRTDQKTQTRRIINPQPASDACYWRVVSDGQWLSRDYGKTWKCPYGQPGDLLWVREEHRTLRFNRDTNEAEVVYAEDGSRRTVTLTAHEATLFVGRKFAQTRARFMYESYSRLTLEIVSVRVERLNDISEADAIAEGIEKRPDNYCGLPFPAGDWWRDYSQEQIGGLCNWFRNPIESYRTLWESINGPGSWALNPWVWVVEFKRVPRA